MYHERQCRSDNKTIVSATLFQEVQRFQSCCIKSEASFQLKLPSVKSLSICEASDSLTINHLYSVEAVRTEESGLAETVLREEERGKGRKKKDKWTVWTWQSYLELSLAGLPGLGWIWF